MLTGVYENHSLWAPTDTHIIYNSRRQHNPCNTSSGWTHCGLYLVVCTGSGTFLLFNCSKPYFAGRTSTAYAVIFAMSWSLQDVAANLSGSEKPFNSSGLLNDSVTNSSNVNFNDQPLSEELHTPAYIPICVGIINGIVFFTGIIGNSLVMLVVCRVKEMRSSTNYFLISLSAADALVLLICQPSAILEFYAQDRWLLGPQMCEFIVIICPLND